MKTNSELLANFRHEARSFHNLGRLAVDKNYIEGVLDYNDLAFTILLIAQRQKVIYEDCLKRGVPQSELAEIDEEERTKASAR